MTDVERSEFELHDVESEPSEFVLRSRRTLLPHGEAHCCCDALVVVRDGRIADVIQLDGVGEPRPPRRSRGPR